MNIDCATHGLDRAREFRDDAVAGAAEHAAAVISDQLVDDLTVFRERAEGRLLVFAHQSAVAGHVGGEDGGKFTLYPLRFHRAAAKRVSGIT